MKITRIGIGVFLLGFCTLQVYGQGFNLFNGRNHPELNWQVAETEHFLIRYPERIAGIEVEAAAIAEATYAALSQNLDTHFKRKIQIFLSDEDEILNGFATRFGYTNIWVHVNEVSRGWSGNTKWLRTVISHELAHLFHYEAIKGNLGFLDFLLGDPLPSFWAEGLAQYKTERWNAYRGDRWLRTAVLDDRLSYQDGRSIWNGRLRYAVGNAQLRYLADQYGDSTITAILRHRDKSFFGLGKTHDFYSAFKETTGTSYRDFYDAWRRHMNIYYNTLAGQLENADSLGSAPLNYPGQYLYDIQYSPDTARVAVLSLASINRPVTRLHVIDNNSKKRRTIADGAIQPPVAWSRNGQHLVFSRRTRASNGSLLNDLFMIRHDGKNLRQLTRRRRAISPSFSPEGDQLAFIASEKGTANIFLMNLKTHQETRLTNFEGDVQLASLTWHAATNQIAFARFDASGSRDLLVLDVQSGDLQTLTDGDAHDHTPVWSPDGKQIAFTSLRDQVPNVFMYDKETQAIHRVTYLVTGATAHSWLPPDSIHTMGTLVITTSDSKQRDRAYKIDAARIAPDIEPSAPAAYASWTRQQPPYPIPDTVSPANAKITKRYRYRPGRNLFKLTSFALPYYDQKDDWGLFGVTSWSEPLAKHIAGLTAALSFPRPLENSFVLATYVNNQLRPSIGLTAFTLLPAATAYGNTYVIDGLTGGDLSVDWPVDIAVRPYTATRFGLQFRYSAYEILNDADFEQLPVGLMPPEEGEQATIRVTLTRKSQRPYRHNVVHPLDGFGVRLELTGATEVLGSDTRFARSELAMYRIFPGFMQDRLFLYGKAVWQTGTSFNQDRPGFARFDDIQITSPQFGILAFSNADRVRGYRAFVYGNRTLFGSAEYRLPFLPSLNTEILGFLSLGMTTFSLFVDGGTVWQDASVLAQRIGVGGELKNAITIGGILQLMHAIGAAQPASHLGSTEQYEIYYRVRASLPF